MGEGERPLEACPFIVGILYSELLGVGGPFLCLTKYNRQGVEAVLGTSTSKPSCNVGGGLYIGSTRPAVVNEGWKQETKVVAATTSTPAVESEGQLDSNMGNSHGEKAHFKPF